MRISKHAVALALTGLFTSVGAIAAHAETTTKSSIPESMDLSFIPLVLFVLAGIVVYLANRPRGVVVYARARRRTDSSRHTPR